MLNWILKSRLEHRCESSGEGLDAATNIYLAHLLLRVMTPAYHESSDRYVATRTLDLSKLVDRAGADSHLKALIYRVNADYLLLFLSVFQESLAPVSMAATAWYRKSERAYEGYGRIYYAFASQYALQESQCGSDLPQVLRDLSERFELYRAILSTIRESYITLLQLHSSQITEALGHELSAQGARQELLDLWLDLYGAWRRTREHQLRQRLVSVAAQLRVIDPSIELPDFDDHGS